jgi:hypothetical protein
MDNTYNTTLTANIAPQTYTGSVDVTTTGSILHYFRRNGGGNIFVTDVSYFKLETTWTDLSGNGNNGTFGAGSAAPTYDSSNGGSLSFDGNNDYVSGNVGTLNAPFTLEYFGKFNNITQNNYEYFGSVGDLSANSMISISKIGTQDGNSSYHGFMYVYTGSGDAKKTNIDLRSTSYQHLTVVLLANSPYIKLYKNGVEGSMVDSLSAPINTNGNFRVGTWSNNTWWLNGNIANTKIYNRALTASEIQQNYNALKSRFGLT